VVLAVAQSKDAGDGEAVVEGNTLVGSWCADAHTVMALALETQRAPPRALSARARGATVAIVNDGDCVI
jgi:hypothetical protein